jgi:2'-5' RNA ligase
MAARRPASGLVVEVGEAEPVVGPYRARLDDSATRGVPAHVTVLFPFVPADALGAGTLDRVRAVVAAVPSFGYAFAGTDWFGDEVLWLAPDDPAPFRDLTQRLFAAFPAHPPFGGEFDDVVPHLTVGHRRPQPALEAAEQEIRPLLPVTGTAREVVLLAEDAPGGRWARRASFPLA